MTADDVFFGIDNARHPAQFDRSQLRLGRPVYVTCNSDGNPEFSAQASAQAEPLHVRWIAPSEWYVAIERVRKPSRGEIELLQGLVGSRCSPELVARATGIAVATMRPEHSYKTREYERTELSKLLRVVGRVKLCRDLTQPDVGKILFASWAPIVEYHFLTCFDLLGQPADWLDIRAWLKSSDPEHVRQRDALAAGLADATPVEIAAALADAHNERFGMRRAFLRFLREVLPEDARAKLLGSILIHRNTLPPAIAYLPDGDDAAKDYLYRLRNDYTHEARGRMGVHAEVMPVESDADWVVREKSIGGTEWITAMTRGWPDVLEDAVIEGVASRLRALARNVDD